MKHLLPTIAMIILLTFNLNAQHIFYVTHGGTGDGSSWSSPLGNIQIAINTAVAGDQVWVAEGSFYGLGANGFTFVMKDNVSLYGGFAGSESAIDQRTNAHISTLAGGYSLSPNDNTLSGTNISTATVVDGFTIAPYQQTGPNNRGIYLNNSSPVIKNCIITGNITFQSSSYNGNGAAVYNDNNSNPQFYNCTFSNNQAMQYGGAVYNQNSSPSFYSCAFNNNAASNYGGAVFSNGMNSNSIYMNCTFSDNKCTALNGTYGGALFLSGTGSPSLINCLITNNTVGNLGAGICISDCTPLILNCTVSNNTATANQTGGAGIYYLSTNAANVGSIVNSIVWGKRYSRCRTDD